jgi:hypothetical protein
MESSDAGDPVDEGAHKVEKKKLLLRKKKKISKEKRKGSKKAGEKVRKLLR